ncbi:signal peptide peptidase-domain-containing protein [Radiomyces spectabilis]|uniref:signal peptide peptidase-domain-containing protein n=1 Tax=Radiomyces spectabilis TaxID=64574 RepID=UPI00221EC082|nr:signal peptide peptidase-domain-containing protein [Radiomyces spectabilis]KAI8393620.1 signal peptide peptidase-domain-containing protein [Radiomyces spectabilis]
MAVIPIYAGSFAAFRVMKRPANAPRAKKKSASPLEDSDDEEEISESLTASDAWMFPVIGSGVLFSLYLLFRFLDKKYINILITVYFSVMGCLAVAKTGLLIAKRIVPLALLKNVQKYKITLSKQDAIISRTSFTAVHGILLLLSAALTVYYSLTKNWIASNVFGISFSINAIQLLSLDSFKTGMILLSGLFFYDVFWVFGTEVMVSVAKNFDAPIKVIWPRDIIDFIMNSSTERNFAMLGLGDIVIPGIFVALCLRFDRHMAWQRHPVGDFRSTNFSKPYFKACCIAYVIGLGTTMIVMHVFNAAQPALLYLSPACILSVLITGTMRGELKDVFSYSSEESDDEKKNKKKSTGASTSKRVTRNTPAAPSPMKTRSSTVGDDEDHTDHSDHSADGEDTANSTSSETPRTRSRRNTRSKKK